MQNTNLISAEVVADSLNQYGERLTTLKLVLPRYVLAELNTHRLFSKNSASSRAIPFKKMVAQVMETPFIPMAWQREHKGMQGTEYITDEASLIDINQDWLEARDNAVTIASRLNHGFWIKEGEEYGEDRVTKQLCNRLLEPFLYHTVLLTASHFENFFKLRCNSYQPAGQEKIYRSWRDLTLDYDHLKEYEVVDKLVYGVGQADIHIMDLAEKMWDAMNDSKPEQLKIGAWHIPFGDSISMDANDWSFLEENVWGKDMTPYMLKIATARCARISYQTLGDNPVIDYAKDIKLFDDLLVSGHMSPFEHCGVVVEEDEYNNAIKGKEKGWFYNIKGFKSYRFLLENPS